MFVELLELQMRLLKKKINKSLFGMCYTSKLGFHPSFLSRLLRNAIFFFLVTMLFFLPFFFFVHVAGKTTGNSLFSAIGYLEHGAVPGGNGHWQIPDSSS